MNCEQSSSRIYTGIVRLLNLHDVYYFHLQLKPDFGNSLHCRRLRNSVILLHSVSSFPPF